jgi:unsaturated rhamnogalacturonyl hydrolase
MKLIDYSWKYMHSTMYRTVMLVLAVTSIFTASVVFAVETYADIPFEIAPIRAPFEMPQLKRPEFPDRTFDIRDYGAVECKWEAEKQHKSSEAINKAITACYQAGGGIVLIPAGDWITGAIHLKSNVNLHIASGATVHFSNDLDDYLPLVHVRVEGVECYNYSPLIYAPHAVNIAITGKGTLHGHGRWWWSWFKKNHRSDRLKASKVPFKERPYGKGAGLEGLRPSFIMPWKSKNILIEGVTLIESPMWNVHPVYSENIIVRGITIDSLDSPNGDGINPDSCKNVLIEYNYLQTGDDAVTIKSGFNEDGLNIGIPCENIVVRNFIARDVRTGSGGIVFGSETSGGIRNVYVHDAYFEGCDRGIRFKTARGRGNIVENIYICNVQIKDTKYSPINVNSYYERDAIGKSPLFRNIFIQDVQVDGARTAVEMTGLPEKWIENIDIRDAVFKNVDSGADFHRVKELSLENVTIYSKGRPIELEDVFEVAIKKVQLKGEMQQPPIQVRGSESGAITIEGMAPDQVECLSEVPEAGIEIVNGLRRSLWSKQNVAEYRKDLAKQERLENQPTPFISPEDFADSLEYIGIAVKKDDTHVWGTSAVIDRETLKVHLFVAEWSSIGMEFSEGWWQRSQIAHYVGDSSEGPFQFVEIVVKDSDGAFNSPHNPSVLYIDGKYVLTFIVNEQNDKGRQRIVMYIADSPNGPWRPARGETDGTILRASTTPDYWNYKSVRGVTNPSLLKRNGKYYLYYKSVEPPTESGKEKGAYRYGVAISDSLEGPYINQKKPVTDLSIELEDGYFFTQGDDDKVYMVSRDYKGKFGSNGGGLIWASEDGLFFPAAEVRRAFEPLSHYLQKQGAGRMERPQILQIDGKPAYMYIASRLNVSGDKNTCSYVFKFN